MREPEETVGQRKACESHKLQCLTKRRKLLNLCLKTLSTIIVFVITIILSSAVTTVGVLYNFCVRAYIKSRANKCCLLYLVFRWQSYC